MLFFCSIFVDCGSSAPAANLSKTKPGLAQAFENFGFEGVRETKDSWIVTGIGKDAFFDNLPGKALQDANDKFAIFFKGRKFPVPTINKKVTIHIKDGGWGIKAFFIVPKPKPSKK